MVARILLATLLAASAASPAAAVLDLSKIPASTFATFAQPGVTRGAVPKLAYYKNEDVTKTTSVTVKTPHTTTTLVSTTTTVNVTTYTTTYVPTIDPKTGKQIVIKGVPQTTKLVTPVVTPTQVTTTKPVTTTTYTSVTTYSTHTTPKAELMSSFGSGSLIGSPLVNFFYDVPFGNAFLASKLTGLQSAKLTLDAISNEAPVITGSNITQTFDTGKISFMRATPVVSLRDHGTVTLKQSNLLTISFTNATLTGKVGASSFALYASTPASTVTYTSDFLNFTNSVDNDLSLSFSAATPGLSLATTTATATNQTNVTGGHTLNYTRATLGGQFAASAVPEPAVWTLMIAGFALIGLRRRRFVPTIVTA